MPDTTGNDSNETSLMFDFPSSHESSLLGFVRVGKRKEIFIDSKDRGI